MLFTANFNHFLLIGPSARFRRKAEALTKEHFQRARALIAGQTKKVKALWLDARLPAMKRQQKAQFRFVDNRRRAFAREDNETGGAAPISILFSAARIQFFSHSLIIRLGSGTAIDAFV